MGVRSEKAPRFTTSAIIVGTQFWSRKFLGISKGGVLLNYCPAVNRETDCPWSGARIIPVHVRRNIKLAEAPRCL